MDSLWAISPPTAQWTLTRASASPHSWILGWYLCLTSVGSPFPPVGPRWGREPGTLGCCCGNPSLCCLASDCPLLGQGSGLGTLGSLSGMGLGIPALCDSLPLRPRERGGFFSPEPGEPDSPWTGSGGTTPSTPTTPTTEGEGDGLSYNQRSLQRWEKDEELGQLSTISPVLYANINFPSLKQDYPGTCGTGQGRQPATRPVRGSPASSLTHRLCPPDWSSRCKQIMKLWRKVPAADKAPYLVRQKEPGVAWELSQWWRVFGKVTFIPSIPHFDSS